METKKFNSFFLSLKYIFSQYNFTWNEKFEIQIWTILKILAAQKYHKHFFEKTFHHIHFSNSYKSWDDKIVIWYKALLHFGKISTRNN